MSDKEDNRPTDSIQQNDVQNSTLSKNQLKKLKRKELALKFKAEKRKKERELRKEKRKNGLAVIEKPNGDVVEIKRKSLKNNKMANSTNKLRIVIDCSFDYLMNESDLSHLGKQLNYCYAINRRMAQPLQLYFTSFINKSLLEKLCAANWDIHLSQAHFLELFRNEPKENIVYLTSDSNNEIDKFDDEKVYIIGGLVDHNHHKSLCYNQAQENKIQHARLPITKYMSMKTRQVLTVNQVYQIIANFIECNDWKQAFKSTLPQRKGAQSKSDEDEAEEKILDAYETNNGEEIGQNDDANVKKIKLDQ